MTREQIAELRRTYAAPGVADSYWIQHITPLLAAAERALLLEDVLAAAKHVREHGPKHIEYSLPGLCAAIDRAEGRG